MPAWAVVAADPICMKGVTWYSAFVSLTYLAETISPVPIFVTTKKSEKHLAQVISIHNDLKDDEAQIREYSCP